MARDKNKKNGGGLDLFIPEKLGFSVQRSTRFATSLKRIFADEFVKRDFVSAMNLREFAQFVTVTHVAVTDDLRHVTVFLSFLGINGDADMVYLLNEHKQYFKSVIARRAKMRYIPELHFKLDKNIEEAQKIERLLSGCCSSD